MIIKSVKLVNFRNHSEYSLECTDETSLILGKNGCGKTSVLEAIYILTRGKSFRAVDNEILKRDEDFYRIELEYVSGEKILATFDGNDKKFTINGKKSSRLPKKNKYPVVLFLPSDLNLISNSPSCRREFFDRFFSQLDERYYNSLLRYNKALKQRNELLKNEYVSADNIFSWNILLSKYGTEIYKYRNLYINQINECLTKTYQSIAKNNDVVEILYKSDPITSEEQYLKKLEGLLMKDKILGHTSFGIHRDDFVFNFNSKDANGSASRGETRSIVLALKFIEADEITKNTGLKPLVLLDDVFSELDDVRRKCLTQNFKNNQVIITSVEA